MPLDIVLSVNSEAAIWNEHTSISFGGNDADYSFLWPTMIQEIKNQTGELLDLYDDAEFSGDDLPKLESIIIRYIEYLRGRKEAIWDVSIGTQLGPVKNEIFRPLVKTDLVNKLEKFLHTVRLAKERKEKIICLGD